MLNNNLKNKIKRISIRGRFAFGMKCIEQYVKENKLENKWITKLIDTLWEFTSSDRLDLWEEKIKDLEPLNIIDNHLKNNASDYKSLSEQDFIELKTIYQNLNSDFVDLIDYVIEIGTGNLYGETG